MGEALMPRRGGGRSGGSTVKTGTVRATDSLTIKHDDFVGATRVFIFGDWPENDFEERELLYADYRVRGSGRDAVAINGGLYGGLGSSTLDSALGWLTTNDYAMFKMDCDYQYIAFY